MLKGWDGRTVPKYSELACLGDNRLRDPARNHVHCHSHRRDLHGEVVAFDSWIRLLCFLVPQGLFENLSRYEEAL